MSGETVGAQRSSSGAVGGALRILMGRYDVAVEDAFELLVRGARRAGLDLRDLATGIVQASVRNRGANSYGRWRHQPHRSLPAARPGPRPARPSRRS